MSRIPRPSPRPLRELPLTDDAKRAALPLLNLQKTRPVLQENVQNENKKIVVAEEDMIEKESSKAKISKAAIPSTSKTPSTLLGVPIHRQYKTLTRSKTESHLKLGCSSTQKKERTNVSSKIQVADSKPDVNASKISKGGSKLKQALDFRDKKSLKFEDPKKDQISIKSKIKTKPVKAKVDSFRLGAKKVESPKTAVNQQQNNPKRNMNRSKTESSINIEKFNEGDICSKETTAPKIKLQTNKTGKETVKSDVVSEIMGKDYEIPKLVGNITESSQQKAMFRPTRETPHGGIRFIANTRKKSISLKRQSSCRTPKEGNDLLVECLDEEREKN